MSLHFDFGVNGVRPYGINSIEHELLVRQLRAAKSSSKNKTQQKVKKTLDVFLSYRRKNGGVLASLIKKQLETKYSVFMDVSSLNGGFFSTSLIVNIQRAKYFVLILTPNALDGCFNDYDFKDWLHKEIVTALSSSCRIIPILNNFTWPESNQLPEDIRDIVDMNGITWNHEYQDATVRKLKNFIENEYRSER